MAESKPAKQVSKQPALSLQPIAAGFPNPAEDAGDLPLDLNNLLIKRPASTFFMRVSGDSMKQAGIFDGDIIIIDRALDVKSGDIVVAFIDGEFTLKHFVRDGDKGRLVATNPRYKDINVTADSDFSVWGVVTYSVRGHRGEGRQ